MTPERLADSETATSDWDFFVENNPGIQELQTSDIDSFKLIREFYDLRKVMRDLSKSESKMALARFGEKLDKYIDNYPEKEDILSTQFIEVVGVFK